MLRPLKRFYSLILTLMVLGVLMYGVLHETMIQEGIKKKVKTLSYKIIIMNETMKKEEVDNVVSKISNITKININNGYMTMLRNTLTNIPNNISVFPDLIDKPEGYLVANVLPETARIKYSETWNGYRLPVLTGLPSGRLGNIMGEYATLYGLKHLYNISVFILPEMRRSLPFPSLSLKDIPGKYNLTEWKTVGHHSTPFWNFAPVELAAAGLFGPSCFINRDNTHATQKFHMFKKELMEEFSFPSKIITKVQPFLKMVADKRHLAGHPDIIYVGFHIRRTDYLEHARWYGGQVAKEAYYYRAMDYYRNKFPGRVVFIAASDDRKYLQEKIGNYSDVFIHKGLSAEMDMAALSSCNHSIITYGSFGFWAGYLAGGEVVYPNGNFTRRYFFCEQFYKKIGLTNFTPLPCN